jgi:hypothetical protein
MKASRRLVLVLALLSVAVVSCVSDVQNQTKSNRGKLAPIQPNKTSELALSMRNLDAELVLALEVLNSGKGVESLTITDHDFLELNPTDSSMLVDGFQSLSMAFSAHVKAFNDRPGTDTYSAVVGGCISCHQRACPGPLERIEKRQWAVIEGK